MRSVPADLRGYQSSIIASLAAAVRAGCIIMAFALCANATLFKGIITDSETGLPVGGVEGVFTLNFLAQQPVYSDSAGVLSATVPFDESTFVGLTLSKAGYVGKTMDFGNNITVTDTYTQNIKMVKLVEAPVSFHGMVIDSVTSKPLAGVEIQISVSYTGTPVLQRITTDSTGNFEQTVVLTNEYSYSAYFVITAPKYSKYSGIIIRSSDSIARTIRLKPDSQIAIRISGRAVDSTTLLPIDSAEVWVSAKWTARSYSALLYSSAGGAFSVTVSAPSDTATILSLSYTVTARGYQVKSDTMTMLPSKDTDLGDILLVKNNARITAANPVWTAAAESATVTEFTLNGRTIGRLHNRRGCASQVMVGSNSAKKPSVRCIAR